MLKLENIHAYVTEKNNKKILNGINLDINPGEVHVIMGPNGSGKSTLANVIMNTGGYTLEQGKITFKNTDITDFSAEKRARLGIFMSYQNPLPIPGVTLYDFIRAALQAKNGEAPSYFEFNEKLDEVMDSLHMKREYRNRYVNVGFSGGERKKSEILQLLMLEPSLAILDETDSGLDVEAIDVVGKGIKTFREKSDRSLLIITHHREILKHIDCDFVHVIIDGKIATTGKPELMEQIDSEGFDFLRRMNG